MSRTIRRKAISLKSFYFNPTWMVSPQILEVKTKDEVEKIAENLFHSDSLEGDSAPKSFRKEINRSERFLAKKAIRNSLTLDSFEGFVNPRIPLPYWN